MGKLNERGYGKLYDNKKRRFAHIVAYELQKGAVPLGLELDHTCRVHCCVNPDHLEPVTHAENVRRGIAGWQHRAKTHCPKGHEYSPENTFRAPQGRACVTCLRDRARAYQRKMRGVADKFASPESSKHTISQGYSPKRKNKCF